VKPCLRGAGVLLALCLAVAVQALEPSLLEVLDPAGLSAPEQAMLASAQGILNRERARVWLRGGGLHARVMDRVGGGFERRTVPDVWTLMESHRDAWAGFIVCDARDASLNLATSLAGPRSALVVDVGLKDRVESMGLKQLFDARGRTNGAFHRYGGEVRRGVLVHQPPGKSLHLRDLAVALGAWTDWEPLDPALPELVRALGPHPDVFGWGRDEHSFVGAVSRGGGWVLPSDWALNLSAHRWLKDPEPVSKPREMEWDPPRRGQRVVAFVISDGDNLQWLLGGFTEAPGFWSSQRRGTVPVTWEMAPQLRRWAPAADAWLRRTMTPMDAFVGGPSGAGYFFPRFHPDAAGAARLSAGALADAGLRVTSVLNDNAGDPGDASGLLADPRIDGVLYKDYAPYNRRKGAISRHHGKPVITYRFQLWEEKRGDGTMRPDWLPQGVAEAVARMSDDPVGSDDAYAVVQVHAWSFRSMGGPMEAIHDTVRRLPPETRVVTAPVLVRWLTRYRARR